MIHIHTTSYDVDFDSINFSGNTFKYPEHKIHWSKQHLIVPSFFKAHESSDVHIVTLSGQIFWAIIEFALRSGKFKAKDIPLYYHRDNNIINVSYIGQNLELSAEYFAHWESGGNHLVNIRNMMGFYKGDQVNKFVFDDFFGKEYGSY